ncbi:MAG: zinc-dependent alcohol dehydrogenase [Byssovorax sp.]
MRAICWNGVRDIAVEQVPEPRIMNPGDVILRVIMSSVCGSDLHLINGYMPTMLEGDILGHEFLGEVVETGSEVKRLAKGDRAVVSSIIGCGRCQFCRNEQWSHCDNSNPSHVLTENVFGHGTCGIFGYSHALGGYAGSHAEYVRVPFADFGAFKVPEGVRDESAVFASDALPTGYMGAEMCNIRPGDIVAVWGAGGVGQMAIRSAYLLGAERVIAIDRIPERLAMARDRSAAEVLDYTKVDIQEALKEMTGGRGPDHCIDAVGMEANGAGLGHAYDRIKQTLRLTTDRPIVVREAIRACRKGGTVSLMGVYAGFADEIPLGALMNKGLIIRTGQQHGQRYIPKLLGHIERGEIDPSDLLTHRMTLDEGARGYRIFVEREDGCMRTVFTP